ncbi:hypothetical protein GCM10009347_01500 [Shewanella algicola]|uniref:Uncharacterized protein n=1 Tax=Shewanella algicola TaxID=640633 RepID=A0A9X2CAU9_9GAMM|nr:hypothetical protein [Shewanella algicola]MCL1103748.1 hypothetical protein [Shewanella algicola]GGP37241.1 hypothetical protein GCM10009347_01500 [Shewanella algicola]
MKSLIHYLKNYPFSFKKLFIYLLVAIPIGIVGNVLFYNLQTECVDDLTDFDLVIDVDAMMQAEFEGFNMWFDEESNQWCMFKDQY